MSQTTQHLLLPWVRTAQLSLRITTAARFQARAFVLAPASRCVVVCDKQCQHMCKVHKSVVQVVEAKEAGAAGVLGIIAQVNGKGTPVMTSFASACGLDAPAEIVNRIELDFLQGKGVPVVAINCSVGMSVAVPGFADDVAEGLLGALPPDCPALVGVSSVKAARHASDRGAAAVLLKAAMLQPVCEDTDACGALFHELVYALSGDD
jgi:hypothetical protein